MLAALLFACNCVAHEPLFNTPGMAQDSLAVYRPSGVSILRIEKSDGRITPLLPVVLLVNGDDVIRALDVDGALLYYGTGSKLKLISVYGGTPIDLADVAGPLTIISHDGGAIYWAEPSAGRIRRIDKRSGVVDTVLDGLITVTANHQVVAFDEHSIFTTALNGGLVRLDKITGERLQMTPPATTQPESIFVDTMNVYVGINHYVSKSGGPRVTIKPPPGIVGLHGAQLVSQTIVGIAGGRAIVHTLEIQSGGAPFVPGIMAWYLDIADLCFGTTTRFAEGFGNGPEGFAVDTCAVYKESNPVIVNACLDISSHIDSIDPPWSSSLGGTLLTINGSGFGANAKVVIDGIAGAELSATPSRIKALTRPSPAGGALLRVSDGKRCTAQPYVVLPPPRREAAAH